jgi:ketosteroid isomerase-like protein
LQTRVQRSLMSLAMPSHAIIWLKRSSSKAIRNRSRTFVHADDVTVLGGYGGFEKGWSAQVEKRYDWASARFNSTEDERRVENISLVVASEMAYSVDIERTKIRLAHTDEVRAMALRVTSVFRRESGQWKVVHRHADPLVEVQPAAAILKR